MYTYFTRQFISLLSLKLKHYNSYFPYP